jgi:hypothetical protein
VGFTALVAPGHVDLLYRASGGGWQGVGTMLLEALEKLAGARGAKKLTAEVSDTATDFFRHRGFTAMQRNSVLRGGEWFANTTMEKPLGTREAGNDQQPVKPGHDERLGLNRFLSPLIQFVGRASNLLSRLAKSARTLRFRATGSITSRSRSYSSLPRWRLRLNCTASGNAGPDQGLDNGARTPLPLRHDAA